MWTSSLCLIHLQRKWTSWSWSYGSWIYNYMCNQCLSSLKFKPRSRRGVLDTTICDKVCQLTGRWFLPGTPVSSINKTDLQDITEILLKVALNTINQTKPSLMEQEETSELMCKWLAILIYAINLQVNVLK